MLRWTPAGLQAIQTAESSGTKVKATHIAIGDGGGQTPDHSGSTMLVNELYRLPIDAIRVVDDSDTPSGKVVEYEVSIPENKPETGSWMIREVAILADDTVIGIGQHPELEKVGKDSPKGTMTHTITAPMVVSNEGVISLSVDPSVHVTMAALSDHNQNTETHQDIREACVTAISDHDQNNGAHQDIREAYATAISEHDQNNGAHQDIRKAHATAMDEIATQKEVLAVLKQNLISTNIRQAVLSYGDGITSTGKALTVKATPEKPLIATISDGFSKEFGNKDVLVGFDSDAVFPFTKTEGRYDIVMLLAHGIINLIPRGSFSPDISTWKNDKIIMGSCTISDGLIVDLILVPIGNEYETPWFPVTINTNYNLPNLFRTSKATFEVYWNSEPTDENKRYCDGQYYSNGYGVGAYKRINYSELIIGSGKTYTFYSDRSGDPVSSTGGYYKLTVRRGY